MVQDLEFSARCNFCGVDFYFIFNWVTFPSPFDKYKIRLKKLQWNLGTKIYPGGGVPIHSLLYTLVHISGVSNFNQHRVTTRESWVTYRVMMWSLWRKKCFLKLKKNKIKVLFKFGDRSRKIFQHKKWVSKIPNYFFQTFQSS